ncbi:MAG: glycoside hydrolase family 16 protein, partial [Pseudobutyrivibrio sp.]|nr:glycoside hydrolase family 16 protein [Pseudobutyrivibrio sp.]
MMKKRELRKRLWAMGMATMMAFASSGMVALAAPEGDDVVEEQPAEEKEEIKEEVNEEKADAFNFEEAETELYVGSDWSGANVTPKAEGTKLTLNVENFGWSNSEWAIQYMVHNLGLKDNTTYTIEFDITSTVDKNMFLKLDDAAGFIAETVSLYANDTRHYTKTVDCGSFSAKPYLYFALGQMEGEAVNQSGVITIENLVITEGEVEDDGNDEAYKKGPEYDFTVDNSASDYADPGKSKDGYHMVWSDEFDGNYGDANVDASTGLNLDNWAYQLGDGSTDCGNYGWGNNELQCYTDRPENVGVNEDLNDDGNGEGVLRITAKRENGYTYANESAKNYTSARLRSTKPTEALFNTTYGYIESRIALPATAGAWPAFWMLPQSTTVYGNWPVSGEIDILETCGAFSDKGHDVACGTLHWGTPTHVYKGSGYVNLDSDYTYFHTYAIDWEPGQITWYYDGKAINTLTNWESAIAGASDSLSFDAPFDMPFYMLLNLAVDSGQFGGAVNKAKFEDDINMYVDYVRVYHRDGGYADAVKRQASNDAAADWQQYAGINQIAEITADNLDSTGGGHDDAAADMSKWYLSNQDDATGATLESVVDANGQAWAKVGVNKKGSQDYSVQLIGNYDAKAGYVYKVSYDAYADGGMVGKTVNCDSKEWKGWSTYGVQQCKLSKDSAHYSFTFQQTDNFDKCRIEFNLGGQDTGNVYISNVKVEIVDPATVGKTESARAPLADGNMVYNGTFDQGDYHLGNWIATADTKAIVPRYTSMALKSDDLKVRDVADGADKYYERRAEISAKTGVSPTIFQPGMKLTKDNYTVKFDLYSKADTAVKVAAYETVQNGEKASLGKELASATAKYSKEDGVRTYTLTFETKKDAENAALVFTFAKGASVQLDNVYMNGANQATGVNEHPLEANDDVRYRGDNGGGAEIPLTYEDGTITMNGITSGGNWYAPQLASPDFELVAGNKYKLSFDYKLSGTNNGTFQYIIQENAGSWHVYDGNGPTTVEKLTKAGGFAHYEKEFVADATISAVHLNFGFGNS